MPILFAMLVMHDIHYKPLGGSDNIWSSICWLITCLSEASNPHLFFLFSESEDEDTPENSPQSSEELDFYVCRKASKWLCTAEKKQSSWAAHKYVPKFLSFWIWLTSRMKIPIQRDFDGWLIQTVPAPPAEELQTSDRPACDRRNPSSHPPASTGAVPSSPFPVRARQSEPLWDRDPNWQHWSALAAYYWLWSQCTWHV